MQDWSLTLCALLQDAYDGSLSDDDGEVSEGEVSEGDYREIIGEDPIVLDGSEGDDLQQTADPLEGLYTGSYQELSKHCSLSHLHCCTGNLLLMPQIAQHRGPEPWQLPVRLVSCPKSWCSSLMPPQPACNTVACCCCATPYIAAAPLIRV